MAGDIQLTQQHGLGLTEARKRLGEFELKLKERFGVQLAWEGNIARVSGKGVAGTLSVDDTTLTVTLKLGLMMRPLAGKIREAMQRQIDRALV